MEVLDLSKKAMFHVNVSVVIVTSVVVTVVLASPFHLNKNKVQSPNLAVKLRLISQ